MSNQIVNDFNSLFLPVQWIDDSKNPGVIDENELWVHPNLLAYNAYCKKEGCEEIDPYQLADAAMKFLKLPTEKRVHNSLLEKDIKSRNRINFSFDLSQIQDETIRAAMAELVKAAAFADLYFNIQRDPNFAHQLSALFGIVKRNPGYFLNLVHFMQNGNHKCISNNNECSSIAGFNIPSDNNGIWFPDEFTEKDVNFLKKEYKWENEALKRKVFTPRSRIVASSEANLPDSFEYNGRRYQVVTINTDKRLQTAADFLAGHMENAAKIVEKKSPELAKYLVLKATELKSGAVFGNIDLDHLWAKLKEERIVTSFGSVENYSSLGSWMGIKSVMQGVVAYVDPLLQKFIGKVDELAKRSDEELWNIWESRNKEVPVPKAYSTPKVSTVVNIVMNTGAMNTPGYLSGGFNQPNYDNMSFDVPKEEQLSRMAYFSQICAARIQNQGLPIARELFDERTIQGLEESVQKMQGMIMLVQGHEIGHSQLLFYSHAVTPKGFSKPVTLAEIYGNHLSLSFEDAKADLLGLHNVKLSEELGIITEEEKRLAYYSHLGNTLRGLNLGVGDEHGRGTIIEFYLLSKYGVISYDQATGKYSENLDLLDAKINDILTEYLDILYSFKPELVQKLDKEALDYFNNSALKGGIDRVNLRGLPEENLPYYMVKGVEGTY